MRKVRFLKEVLNKLNEYDGELLEWYAMSPVERFVKSQEMWSTFLLLGGSLDPEPDSQSPFYPFEA